MHEIKAASQYTFILFEFPFYKAMNNINVIDFVDIETRSVRERGREQQDQWGRQRDVEQSPCGEPPGPGPVTDEDECPVDRRLQQGGALLPDLLHRGGTVEGVQWSVLCINVYNVNKAEQNIYVL